MHKHTNPTTTKIHTLPQSLLQPNIHVTRNLGARSKAKAMSKPGRKKSILKRLFLKKSILKRLFLKKSILKRLFLNKEEPP